MSAPQTNLEKQKRRHRGPLIGITFGLLVGAGLAVFWASSGSDTVSPAPGADTSGSETAAPLADSQSPQNP